MSATTYSANALLNYLFRGVAGTPPAAWYLALYVGDPGGVGEEVSGASYARESVTFAAALNGVVRNSAELNFGAAGEDWGEVSHWAIFDAATNGNMLHYEAFEDVTEILADADTDVKIAAGVIEINLE